MGYRIIDHTADIGVEVEGATRTDLFREGAAALFALLTDRAAINPASTRVIRVDGADLTDLWINYLREILYIFNGEDFLVREVGELTFTDPGRDDKAAADEPAPAERTAAGSPTPGPGRREIGLVLTACCRGEDYDPARHVIKTEIKAVTYHHAEVRETSAGWRGVFIVDV